MAWDELNPGSGYMGAVDDAASTVQNRSEGAQTFHDAVVNVQATATSSVWSGDAGEAFRHSLGKPNRLSTDLVSAFDDVAAALVAYSTEVTRIKGAAQEAHRLYSDGYRTWSVWDAEQRQQAGPFIYPGLTLTSPTPTLGASLWVPAGSDPGLADMQSAAASLRTLADQRQAADDALVAALQPEGKFNWEQTQAALTAAGITSLDDLTYADIADAFANIADDIADGDVSDENIQALTDFFEVWGEDEFVMSNFFLEVGGENTVSIIDNLGDEVMNDPGFDAAAALALGVLVRGGLSAGSNLWDASHSEDFAESMLNGASSTVGGRVAAIGFLFSDSANDPMGLELTIAMADQIDAIERDPFNSGIGGWIDSSPNAGGRTLAFLEVEGTDLDGNRVDDLAGRIFSTLGTYPDAALDWLTDPSDDPYGDGVLGDDRVDYWFGERDWGAESSGDGFEGPGALWAGAQQASGGASDVLHADDPGTWQRIADLTGRVIDEVLSNPSYTIDGLSPAGAETMAAATSLALPLLVEGFSESPDVSSDTTSFLAEMLDRPDDQRWVPFATNNELKDLLSVIMSDPHGLEVLQQGVDTQRESLILLAQEGALDPEEALNRIAALQGVMDHSAAELDLDLAAAEDQQVTMLTSTGSNLVSGAVTVVSAIVTVPGGAAGSILADLTVGAAIDGVENILNENLANNYSVAAAANAAEYDAIVADLRAELAEYLDVLPGDLDDSVLNEVMVHYGYTNPNPN